MQTIIDFFMTIWDGIKQAGIFISFFFQKIPILFNHIKEILSDLPWFIYAGVIAAIVLAVILQIISFVPTESGGNS